MGKLPIDERDDFQPICPHCDNQIERMLARPLQSSILSKSLAFCCPHCRKVLGVTHRKGLMAN